MNINVINYETLSSSDNWTVQSFVILPALPVKNDVPLISLGNLLRERKDRYKPQENGEQVFFIGLENISSNIGMLDPSLPVSQVEAKQGSKVYKHGDILFGRLRPVLNKVLYVDSLIPEGACTTEICVLERLDDSVDAEYISAVLRSKEINHRIINLIRGASLPRVSGADLLSLEIPYPDVNVRRSVIKYVEDSLRQYRECCERIASIPDEIDGYINQSLYR